MHRPLLRSWWLLRRVRGCGLGGRQLNPTTPSILDLSKEYRDSLAIRFWSKVAKDNGCWNWLGGKTRQGYGRFRYSFNSRMGHFVAHRVSYELIQGRIPEGKTLDHLCKNKSCVNPLHLEPLSMRENIMRSENQTSLNAKKQSCKNGHPLIEGNLVLSALAIRQRVFPLRSLPPHRER